MSTSSNQHLHSQHLRTFSEPNFQEAYEEVKTLLSTKLDPRLLYHGLEHTFSEVVPAAIRLAEWEGLSQEDTLIVKTGMYFGELLREGHERRRIFQ